MKLNLFGISGGKDSSALMLWALFKSGYPKDSLRFTFCDTGNEHEYTYEHIELLQAVSIGNGGPAIERLEPKLKFFDLAMKKRRFPSTKARFCTVDLKIKPSIEWVQKQSALGHTIISHSGVRGDESANRAAMPERDLNGYLLVEEYRPLLKWTIEDVFAIHDEYRVPLNRLYSIGAKRVGCYPCIMSRKDEIRTIALTFPERIQMIADQEQKFLDTFGRYSSFFPRTICPLRFRSMDFKSKTGEIIKVATIHDVVKWSMTGYRAMGSYLDENKKQETGCLSGFCE